MFILASGSPRRKELLQQIGANFRVAVSQVAEATGDGMSPEELVTANATVKARRAAENNPGFAVLGADTAVIWAGHIYGKPRDADDAKIMLQNLSGQTHRVMTGLALLDVKRKIYTSLTCTEVRFASLTAEEIEHYVATGEPMDKAGGYALQGRAAVFIESINGSYDNVVGLPLHALAKLAHEAGIDLYE